MTQGRQVRHAHLLTRSLQPARAAAGVRRDRQPHEVVRFQRPLPGSAHKPVNAGGTKYRLMHSDLCMITPTRITRTSSGGPWRDAGALSSGASSGSDFESPA